MSCVYSSLLPIVSLTVPLRGTLLGIGGKGFTSLGIVNLPLLLLVLLVWANELDLVSILNLVHLQGLVGGGGDDLVGIPFSLDWGELPLLGALGWVVNLGDGAIVSIDSDDLCLVILLLVKGKTVEFVILTPLGNKDLVPGLSRLLFITDHGGLGLP